MPVGMPGSQLGSLGEERDGLAGNGMWLLEER